jgi:hypothetical protein
MIVSRCVFLCAVAQTDDAASDTVDMLGKLRAFHCKDWGDDDCHGVFAALRGTLRAVAA